MKINKIILLIVSVIFISLAYTCVVKITPADESENEKIYVTILNREIVTNCEGDMSKQFKNMIKEYNDLTTKIKLLAADIVLETIYGDINSGEYMKLTDSEHLTVDKLSDYMLYEDYEQHIMRDSSLAYQMFCDDEKYMELFEHINNHGDIEYFCELKEKYSETINEVLKSTDFNGKIILEYVDKRTIIPKELLKLNDIEEQNYIDKYNYMTAKVYSQAYKLINEYIAEIPELENAQSTEQYIGEIAEAILYEESANIIYNSSLAPYFSLEKAGSGGAWPRFIAAEIESTDEYYETIRWLYNNIE